MLFLTGGAGYIGAHIAAAAPRTKIVIYDNFANAPYSNIDAIRRYNPNVIVVEGDVRDREHMAYTMGRLNVDRVIHCAGLKSVPEGEKKKALYTAVNVGGTANLVEALIERPVKRIVFSSSAGVYAPSDKPLKEDSPLGPISHYGKTKLEAERMFGVYPDLQKKTTILRYFNPVGADVVPDRGLTNLSPRLAGCADRSDILCIYGDKFPTKDGTAVRDYLPIDFLANVHHEVMRLAPVTMNVGTGLGISVRQMIHFFQSTTGRFINTEVAAPRKGDVPSLVADVTLMCERLKRSADILAWHQASNMRLALLRQWRMVNGGNNA